MLNSTLPHQIYIGIVQVYENTAPKGRDGGVSPSPDTNLYRGRLIVRHACAAYGGSYPSLDANLSEGSSETRALVHERSVV